MNLPTGMTSGTYVGRFAPSPTGPLHFGSLIAAVGSYLQARRHGGQWLLRMEDVDRPRCSEAAANDILRTLEAYGFEWDGEVLYQSQRDKIYAEFLQILRQQGQLYVCHCSRKAIEQRIATEHLSPHIYPGTCRSLHLKEHAQTALRIRVEAEQIGFEDGLQGYVNQQLQQEVGDFVLRRSDGLYAYQLAVVVDDALQGITEVVRGSDLLDNTPRQIYLQKALNTVTPTYVHLPVAVNSEGEKLSKQSYARALEPPSHTGLLKALDFLGQEPNRELKDASLSELWSWAQSNWQLCRVPRITKQPEIAASR
ncbi:MAG: tRNA glutamyl-Q(34) synthetase GluQRS [Gammaproteobacteria bacterium]|nr:tRNA glutamyl-Q(34) synthetase GluQRS [Gammaproteobacteria bacterium]